MKPLWISLFFLSFVAFTGLIATETAWRRAIVSQWEADRMLAELMVQFRDAMNAIELSNSRMKAIRASIVAAPLINPGLISTLKLALKAESLMQSARLSNWQIKRLNELLSLHSLPELPWKITPPDLIGETPLSWTGTLTTFSANLSVRQRRSHVTVYQSNDQLWHARFGQRPSTN